MTSVYISLGMDSRWLTTTYNITQLHNTLCARTGTRVNVPAKPPIGHLDDKPHTGTQYDSHHTSII